MYEVNATSIKGSVRELNNLMDRYDEIMLNLYRQLDEACGSSWQDSNSMNFADCVQEEKKETSLFVDYLNSKKDILSFIAEKYSEFGRKVAYNLNSKNSVINAIDKCYNKANSILGQFYCIDTSFYYPERWSIIQQREAIAGVRNKAAKLKSSVSTIFNKIETIEKEVGKMISALSIAKINEFEFYFVGFGVASIQKHSRPDGVLLQEELNNNISLFKAYSKNENNVLNKIYNKFNGSLSYYKTSNTAKLSSNFNQITPLNKSINSKREKIAKTLNEVITLYNVVADVSAENFRKEGERYE